MNNDIGLGLGGSRGLIGDAASIANNSNDLATFISSVDDEYDKLKNLTKDSKNSNNKDIHKYAKDGRIVVSTENKKSQKVAVSTDGFFDGIGIDNEL